MAKLSDSSCGGFSTATTHGTIDTCATKDGMFITMTLFDAQKLGEKGFISAYMQNGWDDFYETFQTINEEVIKTKIVPQTGKGASVNSNVMIRMGEMKGRTVTSAIEEFGKEKVMSHCAYLEGLEQQNPGKYPANIQIISAIKAALSDEESENTLPTYKLWADDEFKASPTQKNAQGMSLCTRLQITATPGTDNPYLISITQCYAPLKQIGDNGLMAIELSKMDKNSKRSASIFVSRKDFVCCVKEANRRYETYRQMKAMELCKKQMTVGYSK